MKALLLAATSTLALSGFAFAQTPATTTETQVTNPAAAAADKVEDAVDKTENAVDQAVTTGPGDVAEDAADMAEDKADDARTEGTTPMTTAPAETPADPAAPAAAPADAAAPVVAPDVNAPALSEAAPGMLGSWIMSRHIWTTNQPSSTAWDGAAVTERPAEWQDIAKVDDLVLDEKGDLVGYVADIGGFLGIGAKKVLLGKDAIHFVKTANDAFFATNFTKEELKALPDFDNKTVLK